MTGELEVPGGDVEEWLSVLKPYQRETLAAFLRSDSPESAAERWLAMTGSPNIVPFGGDSNAKPFWDRFVEEFRRFVCDDSAYVDEKRSLGSEGPVGKALLVAVTAGAIANTLGLAATLLAPAVVLLFSSVASMGRSAYCAGAALAVTPSAQQEPGTDESPGARQT